MPSTLNHDRQYTGRHSLKNWVWRTTTNRGLATRRADYKGFGIKYCLLRRPFLICLRSKTFVSLNKHLYRQTGEGSKTRPVQGRQTLVPITADMRAFKYLSILIVLAGCGGTGRQYFKKNNCFNNSLLKNNEKIKYNGLYLTKRPNKTSDGKDTTFNDFILFYENGLCIKTRMLLLNVDTTFSNEKCNCFNIGKYKIVDDKIYVDEMDKNGFYRYQIKKSVYKIYNDTTLREIFWGWTEIEPTEQDYINYDLKTTNQADHNFSRLFAKPDYTKFWLLKHNWFWCNEEEFKNWKKLRENK